MKNFLMFTIAYMEQITAILLIVLIGISSLLGVGEVELSALAEPERKIVAFFMICWCILGVIAVIVFPIIVGVYSWKNFDYLLSRSMLYRKSRVDLLATKIKFVVTKMGASMAVVTILFIAVTSLVFP